MTLNRNTTTKNVIDAGIVGIIVLALAQLAITAIAGIILGIRKIVIWIVQKCQALYRKKHGLEPIDYVKDVEQALKQ